MKSSRVSFVPYCPPYTRWDNSPFVSVLRLLSCFLPTLDCFYFLGRHGLWHTLKIQENLYSWSVILQCRKRWPTVSVVSPQKKHLEHNGFPLSFKLSWVSTTSLHKKQTKHATLSRIFDFQIPLHGQWLRGWLEWFSQLYAQPYLKCVFPIHFPPQNVLTIKLLNGVEKICHPLNFPII